MQQLLTCRTEGLWCGAWGLCDASAVPGTDDDATVAAAVTIAVGGSAERTATFSFTGGGGGGGFVDTFGLGPIAAWNEEAWWHEELVDGDSKAHLHATVTNVLWVAAAGCMCVLASAGLKGPVSVARDKGADAGLC